MSFEPPYLPAFAPAIKERIAGALLLAGLLPETLIYTATINSRALYPVYMTRSDAIGQLLYNRWGREEYNFTQPGLFRASIAITLSRDESMKRKLPPPIAPGLPKVARDIAKSPKIAQLNKKLGTVGYFEGRISQSALAEETHKATLRTLELDTLAKERKCHVSDLIGRLTPNDIASLFRRELMQRGVGMKEWIDTMEDARTNAATIDGRPDHRIRLAASEMEMRVAGVFPGAVIAGGEAEAGSAGGVRVESAGASGEVVLTDEKTGQEIRGKDALQYALWEAQKAQQRLSGGEPMLSVKEEDLTRTHARLAMTEVFEGIVLDDE